MNQEARIGYLTYQAARDQLTVDEMSELLAYAAADPEIWLLLEIERWLQRSKD